jgi:DNA-binding response OmpR family regulator
MYEMINEAVKEKILLIEDDTDLSGIIKAFLVKEGYEVKCAFHGLEGIDLAMTFKPTLILLDIMLPHVDGIEVCHNIRTHSHAPIIIISAKNSEMDKLLSLGIGADDYLTKPFSLIEMGARVKSHIRRYTSFHQELYTQHHTQHHIQDEGIRVYGDISINAKSYKVTVKENDIELTSKEFKLLDFLSSHPSQVFSKEQLMDQVWGYTDYVDQNTITVYIGRVREKLTKGGACYIKTIWGVGYKWEM